MAVKKHELVQDARLLDLSVMVKYLQIMSVHTHYLSPGELIKHCTDIVKCLARAQGSPADMWDSLQVVEEFLVRVMNCVQDEVRHEIITAILNKFNQYISDPQSNACAATSVVLVVLNSDNEAAQSTARWLVQQGEGPGGAGLRASLSCLYTWMCQWNGTPSLGDWVIAFIKALEENERFDILMEVTVDNLGHLFSAMDEPGALRQSSAAVIFHVLSSLRESKEALDVVTPHVDRVLTNLASDSGQFSRQLLQDLVDILTEMVYGLASVGNDTMGFKDKYYDVILCLERHMASRGCAFLQLPPWRGSVCAKPVNTCQPLRKVGLHNLGNTCYMNSVMQALLLTRQFSTHVTLEMGSVPYWSKMGVLFAKMMHSLSENLDPVEFFKVFKPPFFTNNNQHDSSEFLGYLFELLQSFEHCSDVNFDYSKPAVPNASQFNNLYRLRSSGCQSTSTIVSEVDIADPGTNRRSVSPRPGSSGSGSSSSSNKRPGKSDNLPLKKRLRLTDPILRRDSFVDSMFGGVLLTRVECTECHSSSLSRDVFRDLQLAFPEKQEDFQYTVQNLLEYYCSEEKLTGDNKYRCRECGVLRDAERSVLVETTPKYLILVLKNFKFEPKLQVQTKLMHKMYHNYSITLPTVRSQAVHSSYVLYAAVIHTGTTLDSGHYYTLGKDSDAWHAYNDHNVTNTTASEVNRLRRCCTPYVLFYRRTDIEEGTAPALQDLPPKLQELVMSHNKEIVDNACNQHLLGCP